MTEKLTKKQRAINYFLEEKKAQREDFHSLTLLVYNLTSVAVFKTSPRPLYHYRFSSPEKLQNWLSEQKQSEQADFERRQKIQAENDRKKAQIQKGTILVSSWGYDQTNVDFYEVIERKNDFVILQEIGKKRTYSTINDRTYDDRGQCIADPTRKIGQPMRKKLNDHAAVSLSSFQTAYPWDGEPEYWSSYA